MIVNVPDNKSKIRKSMRKLGALLIGLVVSGNLYGQRFEPATIENSEVLLVVSQAVKDTFYIQISLPLDYDHTDQKYPVIYVLDANRSFGLTTDISRWLTFGDEVLPAIIVGISYNKDWWQKRSRDYTPTKDKMKNWGDWPMAGGADMFIFSIKHEINTRLAQYRIDWTNRTIIGLSFGGLFVNYALFRFPHMFDNYLMVSPALIWDNKYLFSLTREELKSNKSAIRVFTAIGTLDEEKIITPWRQMNSSINSGKYERISWISEEYHNQTHLSVLPIAITDGLKNLLGK